MGFRDLRAFDMALLAKQCWRIQTKQDSLMAKVLKSKYFPNHSLWDAKQKQGTSYSWRSILHSRWVKKVVFGQWAMETKLISRKTIGSQIKMVLKF